MNRTLTYTLYGTRENAPLVILDAPLGNGQGLEPAALRALTEAILDIELEAEQQDLGQYYRARTGTIDLS